MILCKPANVGLTCRLDPESITNKPGGVGVLEIRDTMSVDHKRRLDQWGKADQQLPIIERIVEVAYLRLVRHYSSVARRSYEGVMSLQIVSPAALCPPRPAIRIRLAPPQDSRTRPFGSCALDFDAHHILSCHSPWPDFNVECLSQVEYFQNADSFFKSWPSLTLVKRNHS